MKWAADDAKSPGSVGAISGSLPCSSRRGSCEVGTSARRREACALGASSSGFQRETGVPLWVRAVERGGVRFRHVAPLTISRREWACVYMGIILVTLGPFALAAVAAH